MENLQNIELENRDGQNDFRPKKFPQVLAAAAVSLGSFAMGTIVAFTSPALPDMERRGIFDGTLTAAEKSWIASVVTLGALISGPFAGYSIEKFGRRTTILMLSFPLALGWLLISFAQNALMMCVGRFLTGFSMGCSSLVGPVYISEICEESIRGIVVSISGIFLGLGILFIYTAGAFVSWFTLSLMNVAVPICLFIAVYFIPESPLYLLANDKKKDAGKALKWLRGATDLDQIQRELNEIRNGLEGYSSDLESSDVEETTSRPNMPPRKVTLKTFFERPILLPFIITMVLMLLQQLCGVNAVVFYTLTIFESAGTNIEENLQTIIVGVVILFSVGLNCILIDRLGRRICLMLSEIGMAVCLISLGIVFYVKETNGGTAPSGIAWIPLASLMGFMMLYNIGIGPGAWLLMSELLPSNVKGLASAIATSFNWMLAFVVTKNFEDLSIIVGIYGCFWVFGIICFIGLFFVFFFVPETKGKTLDEIQRDYFSK